MRMNGLDDNLLYLSSNNFFSSKVLMNMNERVKWFAIHYGLFKQSVSEHEFKMLTHINYLDYFLI